MKRELIASFLVVGSLLAILIIACSKDKSSQTSALQSSSDIQQSLNFSSKTDIQKYNIISSDPDMLFIIRKEVETMNKLTESNINVKTFDFYNEKLFLKILGETKEEYLNDIKSTKEAANRIITRYNLSAQSGDGKCLTCTYTNDQLMTKLKDEVILLRTNKSEQDKFQALLQPKNAPEVSGGGGTQPCCSTKFYACVALCAATIEAFPAYLLCCYFCADQFCCQ